MIFKELTVIKVDETGYAEEYRRFVTSKVNCLYPEIIVLSLRIVAGIMIYFT